jgi:dTDP-4-amino-4,6-dideoxygalactose transaminase
MTSERAPQAADRGDEARTDTDDRGAIPSERAPASVDARRLRRLAPAVTPLGVDDVVAGLSGQRAGTGRDEFRAEIAGFLDATSTGTYTSFRRALCACLLTLSAADDEDRTDVLVPAFCSSDFPEAIDGAGLNAVRYDVDPTSLALDPDAAAAKTDADTLALVSVNVLGYGSEMDRIASHCEAADVFLVEALGYAVGAAYDGERLGTFGDCSVLNFQQGKPIPVGGGMVASRDPALEFADDGREQVAPNVAALSGYAALGRPRPYYCYSQVKGLLDRFGGSTTRHSTHPESKFDVPYAPPFATMSDFQGTIGRRVFRRREADRRRRERTATAYAAELADCPHVDRVRPVDGLTEHQHVRYPLLVDDPAVRDEIAAALDDLGVEASPLYDWPPIEPERFPGAARLQREILTLPTHPYVDADDRRRIARTVRDVAETERS